MTTITQTIAYIHAALIAQVADGDTASLDAQIAEAGLTPADVTIETGLLIGRRAEVEDIAGADIRWVDSVPSLTGGDCAYRLISPSWWGDRTAEQIASTGVDFGGITLDRLKDRTTVVRISARIISWCCEDIPMVTRAGGRLSRDMSIITIPHERDDMDGRHSAALFIRRILEEARARRREALAA